MTDKEERLESLINTTNELIARLRDLVSFGKITANENAEALNLIIKLMTIIENYVNGNVGYETAIEFYLESQRKLIGIVGSR